jgi:hypothetical protein
LIGTRIEDLLEQRSLSLPGGRNLRVFVGVLVVAGRASGLLDLVFDHGDDRMVGDTAFSGTVVVHDSTEPRPALIHLLALPSNPCEVMGARW